VDLEQRRALGRLFGRALGASVDDDLKGAETNGLVQRRGDRGYPRRHLVEALQEGRIALERKGGRREDDGQDRDQDRPCQPAK